MIYVEAPNEIPRDGWDISDRPSIFLAGGITNCEDWQREVCRMLDHTRTIVVNPRRKDFDINDPSASRVQIEWEFRMLRAVDRIAFWFPASETSDCPITLFELGVWSTANKRLVVGVEPGYRRAEDVHIQMELARPDLKIVDNLPDLVWRIR